ncbi:MAG: ThuA domain-containing protein [Lentisphaeria bacterium]|nr:ThuA domain-containing protein [Lentisphaeria bacterium]
MKLFVADDHYKAFPGRNQYECISGTYSDMIFRENDWSVFTEFDLAKECDLLILNMIADTCGLPVPTPEQAEAVKRYLETGKNLLLLHGASSAFWPYEWYRKLVGIRWVRGKDPDGVEASFHPKEPYCVKVAKVRHELAEKLVEMDFTIEDEIYCSLEQVTPITTLMETTISLGTSPQCTESFTPWGGKVINFLPGHRSEVTRDERLIANLKTLIDYLS